MSDAAPPPKPSFYERMRKFDEEALARVEADRAVAARLRSAAVERRRATDTAKTRLPRPTRSEEVSTES